jgi:hypothetical protein
MRQIEVINQETIIDVTAETSNVEILVRDYDSELVERFALEAQEAAIDAEESADIATAQASIATAQATIATTQAGIATTQAGIATTQAGIATTKANEASASAASALASEQAADADRIAAQAAASTATTQAGIATTQAGIATTKAGEASASAAAALASETDAETAASTATTQAGIATTQAGIATTQAGIATTQASNALTSANNAAASAAAAAQVGTSTLLTGLPALTNTAITATDTILQAFAEAQGQINARVAGTGAAGQVAFWNGTSSQTGDSGFLWDNTINRLEVSALQGIIRITGGASSAIGQKSASLEFFSTDPSVQSGAIGTRVRAEIATVYDNIGGGASSLVFFTNNGTIDPVIERWRIGITGILQSNGAQTIQTSTGNLTLATAAGNGNILLTPNGTGNVGINFATPNAKLESRATALIASAVDGNAGIRLSNTQTAAILMLGQGTAGTSLIQAARTSDNTAQLLSLQTYGGNVFIGSTPTDAGFRLDVNGTARVQGVLTTTADAVVNGVNIGRGGGAITTNTRVGTIALNANTTGTSNTAFGWNSLLSNTTASGNTAVGDSALVSNTTGGSNVAIGRNALGSNSTGITNTALGTFAGLNSTSNSNLFFGFNAGRFIADGVTANTLSSSSIFIGTDTRPNADNQGNQIVIGHVAIGLGNNTTVIGNASTTFGRWFGNLLVGSSSNSGQQLQVTGTSLLNGLSTIQGTTASDTAPLGSELATTGTGTNWAGTDFATGYTHTIGSTAALTTTLAAVNGTYYQITYTVTGRTTGSFTINYGGTATIGITTTGATGPRATSTATLDIVPTTDFNGTIVLSVRTISISSASVTLNSSGGTVTSEIRNSSLSSNTIIGLNSGRRNTTGVNNTFIGSSTASNNTTGSNNTFVGFQSGGTTNIGNSNSFFGSNSGVANTTGISNSFFGASSGQANTTGGTNSFFGVSSGNANTTGGSNAFFGQSSGLLNTTGGANSFFGTSSGAGNTTGIGNSFFGENAALNNTTGSQNSFFGRNAGRFISDGTTANTIANDSVFIGAATRANANNQTNQIVIGNSAIGLGSNTTVLGNTSTTFGRWYGSLLLGTTTNAASSILTMESTTQGFLPPRMTTTQKNAIASPATGLVVYDNTLNKLSVFTGLVWETVTSL